VRTIDSFLMNPNVKCDCVLVDEALMVHPGALEAIYRYTGCKYAELYGDRAQIPFINRAKEFFMKYDGKTAFDAVKTMAETRRCPVDATAALSRYYKKGIKTYSEVENSMSALLVKSVAQVPKLVDFQVLVFSQIEKADVKKLGFTNVMTVHEAQGKTFKRVQLLRLYEQKWSVFESEPHAVVAISRHTQEFKYYSVRDNDLINDLVRDSSKPGLRQLVRIESE